MSGIGRQLGDSDLIVTIAWRRTALADGPS
jgi:hypothetical protein